MTVTRAISLKMSYPSRSIYETLKNPDNLLKIIPAKLKIEKRDREVIQFKMSDFDFEGNINGIVESKELGKDYFLVTFSASGETSVGVGIIRYKTKVDLKITFEIIPTGSFTDLRIELSYTSPNESSLTKKAIEFLDSLGKNVESQLPSMISLPKQVISLPPAQEKQREKIETPQAPSVEEKRILGEKSSLFDFDENLSKKLGDPAFLTGLLGKSKSVGMEIDIISEDLLRRIAEQSKSSSSFLLMNCKSSAGKLRVILKNGKIVAASGELEGKIIEGEESIRSFYGKEMMCPIYEVTV
ncbi:MAG: hypothetical protein QW333_00815 [Fervidicoccaceae archaeon]